MRVRTCLFLVVAVACGGDDAASDGGVDALVDAAGPQPAAAVFELPATGAASWGDLPFPHDLYLGEDGTVDIAALHLATPLWESARAAVDLRRGFCSSCGVYFPIDGSVDPTTVPADAAPTTTPSIDDAIFLFDADPDSPERGSLIPLRVEWNPTKDVLSVRPVRGVVLAPERTYAAALTDRVVAEDGTPLSASELFVAARDGGAGPLAMRAAAVMEPGIETLGTLGVPLDRVVSLAVFTTDAPLGYANALRDIVYSTAAPTATFDASSDRVWRGTELDDLLGRPAENRPGWDVPPMAGEEGTTAFVHETVGVVINGSFMAPRVVEGAADQDGPVPLLLGTDGMPTAGPAQRVPFTLIVPSGVDVTALPLMIFHTGTGDHRQAAFLAADTVGRAGMAILAIDPFTQGERATVAVDDKHWLREGADGTLGPDGLYEHATVGAVNLTLLGFGAADPRTDYSPIHVLGALAQQVADDLATIRLVREGDWSAIAGAAPELAGLSFDSSRIAWFGGNQGAAVGAVVLAVADGIGAASLYSPFGSWMDQLLESPDLRQNLLLTVGPQLGANSIYDGTTRRATFEPGVDLFRWVMEPVEPAPAMRGMYADTSATGRPHMLMQLMELDEWVGPPTSESLAAAAGIPGVGDFDFAAVQTTTAPVSGNVMTGDGLRTVVAYEVPDASHYAILQATAEKTVTPPIVPPFMEIEPESFDQPVVEVHAQLEHFLGTFVSTGTPEVCAIDACD